MPAYDEYKKIIGYVAVRTVITDIMRQIETAIQKMQKGIAVDMATKTLIEELRTGRYKRYKMV
jgi:hypothetical protein